MLPFTRDQFLVVFAEYNYQAAVWPPQFVAYALGLAMVLLLFYPSAAMRRTLSAALALMWLWTGVAYHWLHFAAINPVAIGFGTLFVLQGLGFLQAAVTGRGPGYAPVRGASGVLGWSLVGYSTLVLKTWIRFSDAEAVRTGDGLFSRCSGNPALPRWLGSPLSTCSSRRTARTTSTRGRSAVPPASPCSPRNATTRGDGSRPAARSSALRCRPQPWACARPT